MPRADLLGRTGWVLAVALSLAVAGCGQTAGTIKDAAGQAGGGMADAVRNTAADASMTALAPAVQPILDLLQRSETQIKAGNLQGAIAGMGGFPALFEKATPLIQPLAGDRWPAIEAAAAQVIQTFDGGSFPTADAAGSAISGLIAPLSALLAR